VEVPRSDIGVVRAMAAGVKLRLPVACVRLLEFRGLMDVTGFHPRLKPATVVLGAAVAAAVLVALAPMAHARNISSSCTASSSCSPSPIAPSPTPTPVNAFLTLDVTAGDINTSITVTGGAFLAGERVSLYWDDQSKVAGSSTADSGGNFTAHVKPFAGDAPGVHKLCASVAPGPCASFTLQGTSSPSPSASASQSASPSPTESPSSTTSASPGPAPSSTPVAAINGFDVMTKPPLVFLPIIGGLGLLVALAFWAISLATRRRVPAAPAASVSHLATRPDYSAGFGTPPPLPARPAPPSSAWPGGAPDPAPEPTPPSAPEPQALAPGPEAPATPGVTEEPPQPEWPDVPDEPPDLPEPGE
jgi:hypothetical protein